MLTVRPGPSQLHVLVTRASLLSGVRIRGAGIACPGGGTRGACAVRVPASGFTVLYRGAAGVAGVCTEAGEKLRAKCVVITTGTFLRGVVHIGRSSRPAGRLNGNGGLDAGEKEPPATALAQTLVGLYLRWLYLPWSLAMLTMVSAGSARDTRCTRRARHARRARAVYVCSERTACVRV